MSKDRKITKMTIVLSDDPYSNEALTTVKSINTTISNGLKGTVLSDAKHGTAGSSATTKDMNDVLSRDLNKTNDYCHRWSIACSILCYKIFLDTSFHNSISCWCILCSYVYRKLYFLRCARYEGLSSFVPFFSFIIIVSLGVDYSIFLMMRFKEYPDLSPKEAIVLASKHTGGVIISAVIILGWNVCDTYACRNRPFIGISHCCYYRFNRTLLYFTTYICPGINGLTGNSSKCCF